MEKKCTKCQQELPITSFYKQADRKCGLMSPCKRCFDKAQSEKWLKRKLDAINSHGGKCIDCQLSIQDSHYAVFEFHHRDPIQKDFDWTHLRGRKLETIVKELSKCDLLCANCHRIRHANIIQPPG